MAGIRASIAAAAVALVALAAPVAPAAAAFPGRPGSIAYTQRTTDGNQFAGGIFARGPRRAERPIQLTSVVEDNTPSYSADGRMIAFSSNRDPVTDPSIPPPGEHIYVMSADGSEVRQLTSGESIDRDPSFSPDGREVVFDRRTGGGRTQIFEVGIDGSGLRRLSDGTSSDSEPVFAADGRRIVYVSNAASNGPRDHSDIFVMASDGSHPRVAVDGPRNDWEPDVSPSGKRVVFISNRGGSPNLYVARIGGRRAKAIAPQRDCTRAACYYDPVWSPDEKHIAVVSESTYFTDLVVLRADGTHPVVFAKGGTEAEGYGTAIATPSWGPAPR